jgi:hypothetical protein
MGGMLNALLPGQDLPGDASGLINETGVFASNEMEEQVNYLLNASTGR